MFICRDCCDDKAYWDQRMSWSYGPCEDCKKESRCIDDRRHHFKAAYSAPEVTTPEQRARDLLGRMGIEGTFTAGDVVELANLIAAARFVLHTGGSLAALVRLEQCESMRGARHNG